MPYFCVCLAFILCLCNFYSIEAFAIKLALDADMAIQINNY